MAKPDYTLIDYVRWMGAFSFEEKPFSEVDALVLCEVIYFEIFSDDTSVKKTLRELIQAVSVDDGSIVKLLGGGTKEHSVFLQAVSESRRFGEIRAERYAETLDYEKSIQFAAASFSLGEQVNFIAFRGTDDSIAGWREDFMISFTKTIAQDMALEFATANMMEGETNYIGGHSKGGNLALYAASMLPLELQNRLHHVFDLDGPGFSDEVFDIKALDLIQEKTTVIVPEFSVIGKLFEPDIHDTRIVASSETGIMQHELLSWGVTEKGLHIVPENDSKAVEVNRIIDEWVESAPLSERQIFVNEVFDTLEEDGAKTISDLVGSGLDGFEKLLFRAAGTSEVTMRTAVSLPEHALFGNLLHKLREQEFWKSISSNKLVQSVFLITLGILFVLATESLLNLVTKLFFVGLTVLQVGFTIKRLRENNWKFHLVAERVELSLLMIVLTFCLFFKRATVLLGSVIFLLITLFIAVYCGLKASDKDSPMHYRVLSAFECIASNAFGFSFLIVPQENSLAFSVGTGICLIIDGVVRIVFEGMKSVRIHRRAS